MLLLALLVQPLCVQYTRTVMAHTAAELARVALSEQDQQAVRLFALRRLGAVPEASIFHVGGPDDWSVEVQRGSQGQATSVEITGHIRPLPFFGVAAWGMGEREGEVLLLRVRLQERMRPQWLEGDYDAWVQVW